LVDLPGYGFAYAKEEIKDAWDDLVKEYVTTRKGLKRVCMLVDARWGLKPRDEELLYLMDNAQTKFQIVLTKTDVLSPIDLARSATQIQQVCLIKLPFYCNLLHLHLCQPYLRGLGQQV
jgi:GTP-binding protein EngB required for normal cell division